jgi:glycosyltransferase involved in cell wall biosynthesis
LPGFDIAWQPASFRELRGVLERGRFDVVHCHSSVVSPLAYAASLVCRKLGVPSVLTAHSLLGVYRPLFQVLHPLMPWSKWPTRLTAVSRAAAQVLARLSGRSDVGVLANGIDPAQWNVEPVAENRANSEVRVTAVMRLNIRKRPHALLDVAGQVCGQLPAGIRARFTIIGDGPCRGRLVRQARRLGISDRVEFLGTLARPAIREAFRRSDIFVLPTRNEAFGIAVLEARAAGLPIVAMSGCGVADLVETGNQGYLAVNDSEFGRYLTRLVVDRELRQAMALRSRQGVEQFDWEHVVQRHLGVYAQAIAECGATVHGDGIRRASAACSSAADR